MLESGSGSIINISSIVGTDGNIGQSNYAASKGGVISMSKGWAKELARKGAQIRVNCVAPGFIATEMTQELPEKVIDYMKNKTPLGKMGTAQDIADTVSFLASNKSQFITGQVIKVDGGLVL
jgi:3-oxoacyl-[acyl-carrier protein] reductase